MFKIFWVQGLSGERFKGSKVQANVFLGVQGPDTQSFNPEDEHSHITFLHEGRGLPAARDWMEDAGERGRSGGALLSTGSGCRWERIA